MGEADYVGQSQMICLTFESHTQCVTHFPAVSGDGVILIARPIRGSNPSGESPSAPGRYSRP